jgi:hypothetical protein
MAICEHTPPPCPPRGGSSGDLTWIPGIDHRRGLIALHVAHGQYRDAGSCRPRSGSRRTTPRRSARRCWPPSLRGAVHNERRLHSAGRDPASTAGTTARRRTAATQARCQGQASHRAAPWLGEPRQHLAARLGNARATLGLASGLRELFALRLAEAEEELARLGKSTDTTQVRAIPGNRDAQRTSVHGPARLSGPRCLGRAGGTSGASAPRDAVASTRCLTARSGRAKADGSRRAIGRRRGARSDRRRHAAGQAAGSVAPALTSGPAHRSPSFGQPDGFLCRLEVGPYFIIASYGA